MSEQIECPKCKTKQTLATCIPLSNRVYRGKCKNCQTTIKFIIDDEYLNENLLERETISFRINGDNYTVSNEFPIKMTLNDYIRDVANLKGTKVMCREGGCGSCVLNGKVFDHFTQQYKSISVNSCLFPLYSCDGWEFTTIEGVGCRAKGFHPIQQRLADNNGSQCGFCSPGMVMNMYSLLLNSPKPSKELIESSFDGHICRCTGYRPILDAMKSFAADENPIDIEDLDHMKCLKVHPIVKKPKKIHIIDGQNEWFVPQNIDELYNLLNEFKEQNYTLVSANTYKGIYKDDGPFNVFINIQDVPELNFVEQLDNSLTIGANITLSQLIEIFTTTSSKNGFEYLSTLASHIKRVANLSVRNIGTWSGNLGIKYNHPDFPSDIFICFETVSGLMTIKGSNNYSAQMLPSEFLKTNMNGKFIYSITFPKYDSTTTYIKTYKIMPRSQNAHAYVNAGFRLTIDPNTFLVKEIPVIVFGGISPSFINAFKTEIFLNGKIFSDLNVIKTSFSYLDSEIYPNENPVLASPTYRKSLAISLYYKFVLLVNSKFINDRYKSGISSIIDSREVSSGQHNFPVNPSMYPVTKPMTKLNAYLQASGEAAYVFDMPSPPNELHGVFILAKIGNCRIDKIDYANASQMPGVKKIIFARDIPGVNSFMPQPLLVEQLFCDDEILYAGQAVGLVIAETYQIGVDAANAVNITYKDLKPPILTIYDAIQANSFHPKPFEDFIVGNAEKAIQEAPYSLKGNCLMGSQYHFYMESQVSICTPSDDGYEVYSSTQWLDLVRQGIAQVLGLKKSNGITVKTKQLGGAYGGKITRANMTACASAVASYIVNKPVRVSLGLNDCMEMVGKRYPWYAEYNVGFDTNGKLLGVKIDYYADAGCNPNDNSMATIFDYSDNAYKCENWHLSANLVKTNTPANTPCRAPGFFPSISITEYMMEHIAKYLKKDPYQLRFDNLYKKGDVTPHGQPLPYFNVDQIMIDLKQTSNYIERIVEIGSFNAANRWKKRGISFIPLKWGVGWTGMNQNTFVAIYSNDGSVVVAHGGIEMGQGINTKVAQVCAYELGIPLEYISIKPPDTVITANSATSGGSVTSEVVCQTIIQCCKDLNMKLDPIRKLMPDKYTWEDLIGKATSMGVDLCSRYWIQPVTSTPLQYEVYGAAVSEAIIDVLTGETQILRADITYDCGQTINGEIDLGQAEGAFVMGMGFWLQEDVRYDPKTGRCLTNGTWEYKPPTTKDIPVDFRIKFLQNNPNPLGVLGSKCIGEPPLCLTFCILNAVKNAIEAARYEINQREIFVLNSPATVECIQRACMTDYSQFKFSDSVLKS